MTEEKQKISNPIIKLHTLIMQYTFSHWSSYNGVKLLVIFCCSPILFFGLVFFGVPTVIVTIILFFLFMYFDIKRLDVAKIDPYTGLRTDKIEEKIDKLFIVVASLLIPLIVIFLIGFDDTVVGTIVQATASLLSIIFVFGTGAIFASMLNNIEKIVGFFIATRTDSSNSIHSLSNYYVDEKTRIWYRLCFILNRYTEDTGYFDVDFLRKKAQLFKESINIYNKFLVTNYKFVISKPERFYKFVLLTLLSDDKQNVTKLKDGIMRLAMSMQDEGYSPFEFVSLLRTMIKEPIDKIDNIYSDFEIEPHQIKKRIKVNSDWVNVIVGILAIIISIVLALVVKSPIPMG